MKSRTASSLICCTLMVSAAAQAQPATQNIITLSCDGTITNARDPKPEPISKMGLVVNLSERSVAGFGVVARINFVDAANVAFSGEGKLTLSSGSVDQVSVMGDLDRITGALSVTLTRNVSTLTYELVCTRATRLF